MTNAFFGEQAGRRIVLPKFFEQCMRDYFEDKSIVVLSADYQHSAAEDMVYEERRQTTGLDQPLGNYRYLVCFERLGKRHEQDMIVKSKASPSSFFNLLAGLFERAEFPLGKEDCLHYLKKMAFLGNIEKEERMYRMQKGEPVLKQYMPECFGTYTNKKTEVYIILEAFLSDAIFAKTPDDASAWDDKAILGMLDGIAHMQSVWYEHDDILSHYDWLPNQYNVKHMDVIKPFLVAYHQYAHRFLKDYISQADLDFHQQLLDDLSDWWGEIDGMPKTIICGDLTLKNIAIRPQGKKKTISVYDWEILQVHLPQRDVCELLSYILDETTSPDVFRGYIETHRDALQTYSKKHIDKEIWTRGYLLALYDYFINRLQLFVLAEQFEPRNIAKLYRTVRHMIKILS